MLSGIYQRVKLKYLQLYLDAFCYKLNRWFNLNQLVEINPVATMQRPVLAQ